ncbi:MAG: hypothetical protein V3V12_06510 [Gammaproteobacteria bacterium]
MGSNSAKSQLPVLQAVLRFKNSRLARWVDTEINNPLQGNG